MDRDPARVPCPLRTVALAAPDAEAVVGRGWAISYGELDARVSAAERRLSERGVAPGARVGLYMPKDEGYLILLLALMRVGVVACPVSTRLPAGGVGALLQGAGCSALISSGGHFAGGMDGIEVFAFEDFLVSEEAEGCGDSLEIPLDRPATIVFTSGSTGAPKAALHTFGNHYFNALGSNENIVLEPRDRWLHSLPLYHVGGLSILFRCLLAGAAIALPGPDATVGESISELGATHVSLVSTQLLRLLREGDADLSGIKAVLMGGGPVPEGLVGRAVSRGLPVHMSYGLTETASQVTTTPPGASREQLRTSGRTLRYREARISGEGEILVRGRTLFAGYVRDGDLDRPLDEGGWFHTGDLGDMEEGCLRVTGRRDNLFVSGGENVQPEEIEAALLRLGGVEEAVVVPVPDPEFGARPVAFVRTSGEAEDLARKLEKVLPRFKVPEVFHDWEGAGGMKPDRAALEERAARMGDEAGGSVSRGRS